MTKFILWVVLANSNTRCVIQENTKRKLNEVNCSWDTVENDSILIDTFFKFVQKSLKHGTVMLIYFVHQVFDSSLDRIILVRIVKVKLEAF